jgi:Sulfotransferase family
VSGRLPNLIAPGVGKAGTTSLFWYLSQHPDICPSDVKEPRYFAPIVFGEPPGPVADYARHFEACGDERYVMEASPQYFHGGPPMIEAITRTLGSPRVLVVLRDPVARVWSSYRFAKARLRLPAAATFEGYLSACEEVLAEQPPRTRENRPFWTLAGSFYVRYLRDWVDAFGEDLRVVFFEHLAENPQRQVRELCAWLDIDTEVVGSFDYAVENRTVMVRNRALQRVALALNREGGLRSQRWVKRPLRRLYYAVNRSRREGRMPPQIQHRLEETVRETNEELATELRRLGYERLPAWLAAPAGRQA